MASRALVTSALFFPLTLAPVAVQASTVPFSFNGDLVTGNLTGVTFTGTGTYDNQGTTGQGIENAPLSALQFTLLGDQITLASAQPGTTGAILHDGVLYSIVASLQPGYYPVDLFAFEDRSPLNIFYNVPPNANGGSGIYTITANPVPEPAPLLLCGAASLVLLGIRRSPAIR